MPWKLIIDQDSQWEHKVYFKFVFSYFNCTLPRINHPVHCMLFNIFDYAPVRFTDRHLFTDCMIFTSLGQGACKLKAPLSNVSNQNHEGIKNFQWVTITFVIFPWRRCLHWLLRPVHIIFGQHWSHFSLEEMFTLTPNLIFPWKICSHWLLRLSNVWNQTWK